MAVIVGSSTSVTLDIASAGIISIDWSTSANIERLYTLGNGQSACGPPEYASIKDSEVSVSFSVYGGNTSELSTCAADATGVCADSPATVIVSVVPGICGNHNITGLVDQKVYINSYSYSKDRTSHGTEQWSGNAYLSPISVSSGRYTRIVPNFVILGVAEGTIETENYTMSTELQDLVGAHFADDSIIDISEKANVAASQISLGEHVFIHSGTFKNIGGSQFWDPVGSSGVKASASVNLTLQPVYTG